MQMAETLADVAARLAVADTIAISGHHNPDGDCIGSVCALTHLLRGMGKDVQPLLCSDDGLPDVYSFLAETADFIRPEDYDKDPDIFIALDVSDRRRIMDAGKVFDRATLKLVVDHHPGPEEIWDLCYDDPSAAAVGMLVWEFAELLGQVPDAEFATACYVATMTDTGRFQFQNTDARVFRLSAAYCEAGANPAEIAKNVYQNRTIASVKLEMLAFDRMRFSNDDRIVYTWIGDDDFEELGARKQDADNLIDRIRAIGGVSVAFLLRASGNNIRGSIRAKDATDVASVAMELGGGGHRAAAGFTLNGTVDDAIEKVLALLKDV